MRPVETPEAAAPIRSIKGFLLHVGTVSLGVLIALSFEGAREWLQHRSLVHDATENLIREVRENKASVDRAVKRIAEERADLQKALVWATDLLVKKQTDVKKVNIGTVLPQLTTASWRTAESTGALGHMKYAVVNDFAQVYDLQDVYTRTRLEKLTQMAAALGLFNSKLPDDQRQAADYQDLRARLLVLLGNLWAEEQLARDLGNMYSQLLRQYGGGA
jgi:hypothetical protein